MQQTSWGRYSFLSSFSFPSSSGAIWTVTCFSCRNQKNTGSWLIDSFFVQSQKERKRDFIAPSGSYTHFHLCQPMSLTQKGEYVAENEKRGRLSFARESHQVPIR
jgi:hypothetical protein